MQSVSVDWHHPENSNQVSSMRQKMQQWLQTISFLPGSRWHAEYLSSKHLFSPYPQLPDVFKKVEDTYFLLRKVVLFLWVHIYECHSQEWVSSYFHTIYHRLCLYSLLDLLFHSTFFCHISLRLRRRIWHICPFKDWASPVPWPVVYLCVNQHLLEIEFSQMRACLPRPVITVVHGVHSWLLINDCFSPHMACIALDSIMKVSKWVWSSQISNTWYLHVPGCGVFKQWGFRIKSWSMTKHRNINI